MVAPLFNRLITQQKWLHQGIVRATLNLENRFTPHFTPKEVVPLEKGSRAFQQASPVLSTHPDHLAGTYQKGRAFPERSQKGLDVSLNGNGVDVENERQTIMENRIKYEFVTNVYRMYDRMLRKVLSSGSGSGG